MGRETGKQTRKKSKRAKQAAESPLSPAAEARLRRRLALLLGLVPLPEMTQEEADWVFYQRLRLADDE